MRKKIFIFHQLKKFDKKAIFEGTNFKIFFGKDFGLNLSQKKFGDNILSIEENIMFFLKLLTTFWAIPLFLPVFVETFVLVR